MARRVVMETKIQWETDMSRALAKGKSQRKHLLVDFFNPG
jgi:hypothetical protein